MDSTAWLQKLDREFEGLCTGRLQYVTTCQPSPLHAWSFKILHKTYVRVYLWRSLLSGGVQKHMDSGLLTAQMSVDESPACCIPSNVIWRGQNHGCGSSQKGHMGPSAELPPLQEAWLTLFSLFHAATYTDTGAPPSVLFGTLLSVLHWLFWEQRHLLSWRWLNPIPPACWQSGSQDYAHIQDYSSLLFLR